MFNKKGFAAACMLAAMTMVPAVGVSADELIAIPYMRADGWQEVAMTNDDKVMTGINIRMAADVNSEVVGYLFRGGAAWVLNRGEEWTEVSSGEISGFIKNEYLMYGATDDITGLADYYGLDGVTITWDGVKVFAEPDPATDFATANTGDDFVLVDDGGHWLQVEYGDGTAYLSREDVTFTVLLETAYTTDELYHGHHDITAGEDEVDYEQDYDGPSYSAPSTPSRPSTPSQPSTPSRPSTPSQPSTPNRPSTPPQTEAPETNPPQTEAPETNPPQTEAPETNPPQTEAPETNPPQTDAPETDPDIDDDFVDEPGEEEPDIDLGEDGWYDADTDTYYDGKGNVIG